MEIKQIGVDELFYISEIADKMDLELPEFKQPDLSNLDEKEAKLKLEEEQTKFGIKITTLFAKKAHKAKPEIKALISRLTDKNVDEMSAKEFMDVLVKIISQDGVLDAFK